VHALGGIEGLEYAFANLFWHAGSGVLKVQFYAVPVRLAAEAQAAAVRHRIDRINN
jgi:hypothetical protein